MAARASSSPHIAFFLTHLPSVSRGGPSATLRSSPSPSSVFGDAHPCSKFFWCHNAFLFAHSPLIKSWLLASFCTFLTVDGGAALMSLAHPWAVEKFPRGTHHPYLRTHPAKGLLRVRPDLRLFPCCFSQRRMPLSPPPHLGGLGSR